MFKKTFYLLIVLSSLSLAQMISPKISVQPMSFDFGRIVQGEKVNHTFTITNTGGADLLIMDVRASCGCTAATPEKNKLAPNESTELNVEFNSAHKMGKQTKFVYIKSNDPENKTLKIRFDGMVEINDTLAVSSKPKIYFPETEHDFGKVKEGKIVDYTFKLSNNGNSILKIDKVNTSCGCTAALLSDKEIEPGKDGTIKVEFDTKNRSGEVTRTVAVSSNDPEEPNKILIIKADVEKN